MPNTVLFDDGDHRNILLEDFTAGGIAVQANQHLVVHGGSAMILDPGGHKVFSKVMGATKSALGKARLDTVFLSHQDPDIVAAVNGWLMTTDATAYVSKLWTRFVPHFGMDHLVEHRLLPIPDEGMKLPLGSSHVLLLPAHFLHSCGNFHVYDPIAKVLYTSDLGASIEQDYVEVTDFEAHRRFMEGFHRRYMAGNRAMKIWARTARKLDIEIIAPQHGAFFRGKEMVSRFIDWADGFACGMDLLPDEYPLPT